MSRDIVILGAGGHARVVLATLRAMGLSVRGCLAPESPGTGWPTDVPWLGGDEALAGLKGVELANGVGSVGDVSRRKAAYEAGRAAGLAFVTPRHPSAIVEADAVLGEGAQVMAGAIVQTGVRLGCDVIVNSGAIIDHDCEIGDHAHIAPGVRLSGGVKVGAGAHVGIGAVVIQGVNIGAGAVMGAGAVVLADVAAGERVAGAPARPLKGAGA